MNKYQALKHLKAVTQAFGPHHGVSFDQKAWDKMHNALEVVLAQHVDASDTSQERVDENAKQRQEQEPVGEVGQIDIDEDGIASAWFTIAADGLKIGDKLYSTPPQRKPLPPKSPCEMTQAEGKMFKLGWLECEAAHGIKE